MDTIIQSLEVPLSLQEIQRSFLGSDIVNNSFCCDSTVLFKILPKQPFTAMAAVFHPAFQEKLWFYVTAVPNWGVAGTHVGLQLSQNTAHQGIS